jgi:hypothetical protein
MTTRERLMHLLIHSGVIRPDEPWIRDFVEIPAAVPEKPAPPPRKRTVKLK